MALTFQVVLGLRKGYGAAGIVVAATTVGSATAAPLIGRLIDRYRLRRVLAVTVAGQFLFWGIAPVLPYSALVMFAFLGGLLAVPVHSIIRQAIAALVSPATRRQAYSLESVATEIAYLVGPPSAVLIAALASPRLTMLVVGSGIVAAGVAILVLDPPVRAAHEAAPGKAKVPVRHWLTWQLVVVLLCTCAAMVVVGGTDVIVVAVMREAGQTSETWLPLAAWCVYSMLGGLIGSASSMPPSMPKLLAVLSLATMPVGLASGSWPLTFAMLPAGLLCAPTMSATADAVSRLAPAEARGVVIGLHGSFGIAGVAFGAPLAGAVTDLWSTALGSAAIGLVGLAVALIGLGFGRRG